MDIILLGSLFVVVMGCYGGASLRCVFLCYQLPFLNDRERDIGIRVSHVANLRSVALLLIIIGLI